MPPILLPRTGALPLLLLLLLTSSILSTSRGFSHRDTSVSVPPLVDATAHVNLTSLLQHLREDDAMLTWQSIESLRRIRYPTSEEFERITLNGTKEERRYLAQVAEVTRTVRGWGEEGEGGRGRGLRGTKAPPPPTGAHALTTAINRIAGKKKYGRWIALLKITGWQAVMQSYIQVVPVTVLLPNDAAFSALPSAKFRQLLDKNKCRRLLQFHMLQQVWPAGSFAHFHVPAGYPTVLGSWNWHQKTPGPTAFGIQKVTPVSLNAQIVDGDTSGTDLRLVVMHGVNRVEQPPGILT